MPTSIAIQLLKILATPGAFLSMTNGETYELTRGLQEALNKAFSTAPKAASKAG